MANPPPAPTPPVHSGMSASNNGAANGDRTANLLNLLKFNSGSNTAATQRHPSQDSISSASALEQQQQQRHQQVSPPPSQGYSGQQQQYHQGHHFQHHASSLSQTQFPPQPQHLQNHSQQQQIHQPAPTSADPTGLLAALMRGASQEPEETRALVQAVAAPQAPQAPQQNTNPFAQGSPPPDTTSYLLNLLNRPKPSQNEPQQPHDGSYSPDQLSEAQRYIQQARARPQYQQEQQQQQQQQQQQHEQPYPYRPAQDSNHESALLQQLMGNVAQSSPQSHSSHQAPYQILQKSHASPAGSQGREHSQLGPETSPYASPRARHLAEQSSTLSHASDKHTPQSSDHGRHSAVKDTAPAVDHDARDALARAEQDRARSEIAEDINGMLHAKSETEFHQSATAAAQELKKELDSNEGILEEILPTPDAEAIREIVDDAAAGGVADSWESADQDEIVVIEDEEKPIVKVYNFPMKPWISISLQDGATDPCPEFRPEAILDVARLKKDFDQIDRNLFTASQTHMAYGMSKQGGLRVIRQDDGKDARVFTDTKDRIFNVAMSVTPADHDRLHREAIIGTGISGTVYWVQIKDGEKDHIDDAHLEQYGFALPPISTHEGDAPGGALKTRARASTHHPEYFAVGRGKSIHLVWPSYIMQQGLFKPGHDRVVDTDKLVSQSNLKINTGKAGKDFNFSQDDTVVVSLDKSGRVKFWDVRDLTAAKEDSDGRTIAPAHAKLEVKEPLMTLASTPEGEKAWPTSVLLLDKARPYQKRCALRYMIVGMKQNHTLQLWDLALGKPVQEFNLPHSKESDAVCSVMYHAATGMIVIGHPTRNSVYFAHLSAPKYNLKGISQAEYIQRLAAQDTSIPQPDSTAVISGVREYSFESRGILRSLDILANPNMSQGTDEPTLFELYAMHSKGVACLLIKQPELGWTKDNKVIEAVDAVKEGVITVDKLNLPQPVEPPVAAEATAVRTVNRNTKEQQASSSQSEETPKPSVPAVPAEVKADSKENETPSQSAKENDKPEKPERRPRKKKAEKAAEKAAAAAAAELANGTNNASNSKDQPRSGLSADAMDAIHQLETRLNVSLSESFQGSLKDLQGKIDERAKAQYDNFGQHQVKLLDSVSEVLNENTQKVLEALIHQQFTESVVPAIGEKAGKAVSELLDTKLQPHVASTVQKEIQSSLPQALTRSLKSNDFVNAVSDRLANSVASSVQKEVVNNLMQRLTPSLTKIAQQSAQNVANEVHQQYREQSDNLKAQHAADNAKMDQLMGYVTRLTEMVSTMAQSQSNLQAEFLKFRQQPSVHELPGISGGSASHPNDTPRGQAYHHGQMAQAPKPPSHQGTFGPGPQGLGHSSSFNSPQVLRGGQTMSSPQASAPTSEQFGPASSVNALASAYHTQMQQPQQEVDQDLRNQIRQIEQLINENRLQDAIIRWIQSGRETEIFRDCLSRYPPSKFEQIPHLLLLVVIATISKDLKPNPRLKEEVDWLEMAVRAFGESLRTYDWEQPGSREVLKSTSQTISMLVGRMNPLLASISDGYPTDPFLMNLERNKLDWIVRTSQHILDSFGGHY